MAFQSRSSHFQSLIKKPMGYLVDTNLPVRSSKIRIPRDQKSTLRPWPLFRMISGATYSGVPQNVHVFWPHLIFFAKPKSTWQRKLTRVNHAVFLMLINHTSTQKYQQLCLPVLRIHLSPTWGSQVLGPCKLFLFCVGTQKLQ